MVVYDDTMPQSDSITINELEIQQSFSDNVSEYVAHLQMVINSFPDRQAAKKAILITAKAFVEPPRKKQRTTTSKSMVSLTNLVNESISDRNCFS